jgi:Ca2+-transporting ATPase
MGSQSIFTSDNVHYNITHSTSLDPNIGEIQIVSSLPLESSMCGITPTVSEPISVKKTINDIPGGLVVSMMVCSLCSNSTISKDPDTGQWVPIGDPTEVALTVVGMKSGLPKEYFQEIGLKKLGEYAFDRFHFL